MSTFELVPRQGQRGQTQSSATKAPARPELTPFPGVRVAVVVPCYKVERHIEAVLAGIPPWVAEIIAVDDASPDGTLAALERVGDARLLILRHEHNLGVGGAMQTGFGEALRREADIVVKMDGDDQMDPAYLTSLVAPLVEGRADVCKGNRWADLRALRSMPAVRLFGNTALGFLVKIASGYWSIFDPTNGYVALRAEVLRLLQRRLPRRYFFESGLLIELGIQRAMVLDVPIPARYGEERSSLSISRAMLGFPPRLVLGLLRRIFWRYYIYDFSAVSVFLLLGLPMMLLGASYGATVWTTMEARNDLATAGQVMIAAMPIILGFQMVLQAVALDIANTPRSPLFKPLLGTSVTGA